MRTIVFFSQEYGALFYEASACTGAFVHESLQGAASLLCEHEDKDLERTLDVSKKTDEKRKCCD